MPLLACKLVSRLVHFSKSALSTKIFSVIYSILVGLICLLKPHTPNFAWMHAIWPYEQLVNMSHWQIFSETFIPVFRPSLHIERELGRIWGLSAINIYNLLVYSLCIMLLSYISVEQLRKLFTETRQRILKLSTLFVLIGFPFYIYICSYGSFVDVMYPLFAILLLKQKDTSATLLDHSNWLAPNTLLFSVFLVGLSHTRPYAPVALLIFLLWAFKREYRWILASIFITLICISPYHYFQWKHTQDLTLSNWGGCNLAEVFPNDFSGRILGVLPYHEAVHSCHTMGKNIVKIAYNRPLETIQEAFKPARTIGLLIPHPFGPYARYPSAATLGGFAKWASWVFIISFFYAPVLYLFVRTCITNSNSNAIWRGKFLDIAFVAYPLFIAFISHGGGEAARISLPFYLPVMYWSIFQLRKYLSNESTAGRFLPCPQ